MIMFVANAQTKKNPQSAAQEGVTSRLGLLPLVRQPTRDGAIHAPERWRHSVEERRVLGLPLRFFFICYLLRDART